MTSSISEMRMRCIPCNRIAPSQPSAPPTPPLQPQYHFQCVCTDFFQHAGHHYLVIVDRYSNWPIAERAHGGSQGLIRTFTTFGISDELSSDGGPEFPSTATLAFLRNWGVLHRLPPVAFPHSNSRAEIGVKTVKRMILSNTTRDGGLEMDSFQRAILQYRNTPDRDTRLSPAMCILGRQNPRLYPNPPRQVSTPLGLARDVGQQRRGPPKSPHEGCGKTICPHTRINSPISWGLRSHPESDWTSPNEVGQNRNCHRGPEI